MSLSRRCAVNPYVFFFNDTATTEIYTLSLHDALPILGPHQPFGGRTPRRDEVHIGTVGSQGRIAAQHPAAIGEVEAADVIDRKSTRLNSSHVRISYAVFCLKKQYPNFASTRSAPRCLR